jgi:hypothetical protein
MTFARRQIGSNEKEIEKEKPAAAFVDPGSSFNHRTHQ